MKKYLITLLFLTISSTPLASIAGVLEAQFSDAKIENIQLVKSGTAKWNEEKKSLVKVATGIRSKKVVFVNVQVYLAELLATDQAKIDKNLLFKSLIEQDSQAIKLTFLRSVDSKKIVSSFEEAFKLNSVDLSTAEMQKVIEAVKAGGDIEKSQTLFVWGFKKDNKENIIFEDNHGKVTQIVGSSGFIHNIFSLWLGKAADSGVEAMQNEFKK